MKLSELVLPVVHFNFIGLKRKSCLDPDWAFNFVSDIDTKQIGTINGKQYYFSILSSDEATAKLICLDMGGYLLALETEEEFEAVTSYIRMNVPDSSTKDYLTSLVGYSSSWLWSETGQQMLNSSWFFGNPDTVSNDSQYGTYLHDGYLYYYNYGLFEPAEQYICEEACVVTSVNAIHEIYEEIDQNNPHRKVYAKSSTGATVYFYDTEPTTSAAEALAKCVERNMTLVSFLTLDQFNGAVDLMADMNISAYNFWTSGMMIFGNWTWGSNGKLLTYSAWADREPDYQQGVYNQACILLQNSELYDVDCYFGGVGYICEQPYSC